MSIINNYLTKIEEESKVKILYAAEAGSRAWGFPSKDSDYDVRCIYIRPLQATLRLRPPEDNFEKSHTETGNEILDIAGWELNKTLGLLYKSNAALLEWLHSPIKYIDEDKEFYAKLKSLAENYMDKESLIKHYSNMAQRCLSEHLRTPMVKLKKYFYCIRPLLAAQWVLDDKTGVMPPIDFMELLEASKLHPDMRFKIKRLYDRKLNNESEGLVEAADFDLLDWIMANIKRFRVMDLGKREEKNIEALDNFLYNTVMSYEGKT